MLTPGPGQEVRPDRDSLHAHGHLDGERIKEGLHMRRHLPGTHSGLRLGVLAATAVVVGSVLPALPAVAQDQPITLTFWDHIQESRDVAANYAKAAEEFKKHYPNVTVNIETTPFDQYHDKLLTAVKGGAGPDIMSLDQPWMPEFAASGVLLPLDDYVAGSDKVNADAFFPAAWDTVQWNGHQWGVPLGIDVWSMLVWNPDLFKAAGLDPTKPPKTWAELLDYAQKLTKDGVFGIALPAAKSEVLSLLMDMFTYSNGGRIMDDAGNVVVNSPEAAAALDFLFKQLIQYAPTGALSLDHGAAEALFTSGKVAMMFDGNWAQETLNSQAKFDWQGEVVPAPTADGTFHGATGGWNLAVNAKSPNADMAYKWIEYLTTTPEIQNGVAANTPAHVESAKTYIANRKFPDVIQALSETGMARPKTAIYPQISEIQQTGIQRIISGETIDAVLGDMQKEMEDALANQ
jgi:multiple sugar transport system substrate-binding protein